MSLRIREDGRRFRFYSLDPGDRDRVLKQLSRDLSGRREILLAVVYGGFVEHDIFRDIDIAVFTGYSVPYSRVEEYEEKLSRSLEKLIDISVDLRLIDYSPPWFRVKALRGIILVEREPALAERLRFKSIQEMKDIEVKLHKLELSSPKDPDEVPHH